MNSARSATRRHVLAAIGVVWAGVLAGAAQAQQPLELKIMAPANPGGGWDQTARSMQQALIAAGIARSAQVTNVGGAGGSVGIAQFVNSAKGDGTQLMVNGFVMVGALAMNKSPVTLEQVTPIARLTEEYQVMVVPANSPIKDVKDLAAALKADIAKVTFAGGSAGGIDHIMAALFAGAVGADATKVNYVPFSGGGESLAAILGGKVTAGISGYGEYEGQIKSGKLRAIGITSPERRPGLDIPTFKEQGVDLVLTNWRSVVAAPGITPEQKKVLSDAIDRLVKSPAWKEVLAQKGWDDAYLSGDAFADFLKKETARVNDVLKSIGLVKS
ncbi:C4-dicarboxylate ABC transporter substrate-binding protein [Afipia sp. P52-10]|jgi:putative tricarboxylic transport membrane protein|uniref:Bug family tripartite tricarboxylate transporter substrate binding protein n=1 Tax=Afipia sp. P52-10 TaxID=1429916 RepID=UPI0003DEFBAA|nr:tripartite tricarboxylate transporter substrate-binding protein [Afipia sp. P52-10]ETR77432.1 C4-dicarboxylate ABC transporter substrate-binding protein [Afipia sp. P52-10]